MTISGEDCWNVVRLDVSRTSFDLEKHPGIVAAGAATDIAGLDFADVEAVDYCAYNSCWVIPGKIIAKTRGKQPMLGGRIKKESDL